MAEDKKVTISRSLNGDTIYYIARNSSGVVFARELTMEALQKVIKTYKEPPPVKEEEKDQGKGVSVKGEEEKKKFLTNKIAEKVQERKNEQKTAETTASEEPKDEEDNKKLLENELQTKVQERKEQEEKSPKKKSFWDKLK